MARIQRRPRTHHRPMAMTVVAGVLTTLVLIALQPGAHAGFSAVTTNTGDAWAADLLQPPPGLTATPSCSTSTIVHVRASTATGSGSLVLPTPSDISSGDVLVAQIGHKGSATVTPPAGWTALPRDTVYLANGSPQVSSALFWRVAGSGEPSSATFTLGSAVEVVGGIAAYRGVSTVDPVNTFRGATGTGTTATTPSLTTTVANTMLVDFTTKWQEALPAPAGAHQRWRLMSGSGTAHLGSSSGDVTFAGTGATPTRSSTSQTTPATATEWIAQTVALRPIAQRPAATVTWTPTSSSWATGYKAERIAGGTVQETHTVPLGTTTVTDTGLVNGTTYTYRVRAYRGSWVSSDVTVTLTPSC